jgi:hypothetical protein
MGGSSGFLTGDSIKELKQSVKAWYYEVFSEGLYPNITKNPSKKDSYYEKRGIEFITIQTDVIEKVQIHIIKTEEIPEGFHKGHMRKEDLTKKFACFVSAHT